jgi:hypothetical protein
MHREIEGFFAAPPGPVADTTFGEHSGCFWNAASPNGCRDSGFFNARIYDFGLSDEGGITISRRPKK